jgi:hypothetical protein
VKVILLYIALVGLPLIGVAGVLQLGQHLRPPVSVSGTWGVQISSQPAHSTECKTFQAGFDRMLLDISQSGQWLVVAVGNADKAMAAELIGEIDRQTIIAEARAGARLEPSAAFATGLQAKLDRQSGADRLLGVLRLACCRPHAEVTFVASRQHKDHKVSGAH